MGIGTKTLGYRFFQCSQRYMLLFNVKFREAEGRTPPCTGGSRGAPPQSKMALFGPQETYKFPATRPLKKNVRNFLRRYSKKRSTIFSSQVSSARSASASLSRPSPEDGFPKCRFPEPGRLIRCEGGSGVIFWGRTGWSPNKKHQFLKTYRIMHPYLC